MSFDYKISIDLFIHNLNHFFFQMVLLWNNLSDMCGTNFIPLWKCVRTCCGIFESAIVHNHEPCWIGLRIFLASPTYWLPTISSLYLSSPGEMSSTLADNNFKYIFLNENYRILIWFSLKFVPRSPIYNKHALVQVMAWHWSGNKPLPEPMLTQFTDTYMRH